MVQIMLEDTTAEVLLEKAKSHGMTLEEFLRAVATDSARLNGNGASSAGRSAFDVARELGILGSIADAPADLSTNPSYLEGLGK